MKATNLIEFALVFRDEAAANASAKKDASLLYSTRLSEDIEQLRKLAIELERLNLNACNYGLSRKQETRRDNVADKLAEICQQYGIDVVTQGDPRGCAFGIICNKTRRYNSMGGFDSGFRLIIEGK